MKAVKLTLTLVGLTVSWTAVGASITAKKLSGANASYHCAFSDEALGTFDISFKRSARHRVATFSNANASVIPNGDFLDLDMKLERDDYTKNYHQLFFRQIGKEYFLANFVWSDSEPMEMHASKQTIGPPNTSFVSIGGFATCELVRTRK